MSSARSLGANLVIFKDCLEINQSVAFEWKVTLAKLANDEFFSSHLIKYGDTLICNLFSYSMQTKNRLENGRRKSNSRLSFEGGVGIAQTKPEQVFEELKSLLSDENFELNIEIEVKNENVFYLNISMVRGGSMMDCIPLGTFHRPIKN